MNILWNLSGVIALSSVFATAAYAIITNRRSISRVAVLLLLLFLPVFWDIWGVVIAIKSYQVAGTAPKMIAASAFFNAPTYGGIILSLCAATVFRFWRKQ